MNLSRDKAIAWGAILISMPIQVLSSQVLYISLCVFLVFLIGSFFYLWIEKQKITKLFNDPVLFFLSRFLTGALVAYVVTFTWTSYLEKRDKRERKEMLTEYISQRIVCDLALNKLDKEKITPSYEWLDSMGIVNNKSIYDVICGLYYGDEKGGRDFTKARSFFEKASKENHFAAFLLGKFVYMGLGDIPDKRGLELMASAAEHQVLDAQFELLGLKAISNNVEEAEKWYSRIIHAEMEDNIYIEFKNSNMIGEDSVNDSVLKDSFSHIYTISYYAFSIVLDLQRKAKKPYAANKICKDYITQAKHYVEDRKKLRAFIDAAKYVIFMDTGNVVQAKRIAKKHSSWAGITMWDSPEISYQIPFNVNFKIK